MQRYLSTLAVLYGRAGLCLGTITFYDVPSWAKNKWATGIDANKTSPCDGLDQMFTLSKEGNALNFFLVDSITQGSSTTAGEVVGIDGTIAGPSSIGGTVHSGAVVNFSDYASGSGCSGAPNFTKCGADVTAYITAHEGGHWMGLYHTTESIGGIYNPLSDSPQCICDSACGVASSATACCYESEHGGFTGSCTSGEPTFLTGANCTKSTSTCGGGDFVDVLPPPLDSYRQLLGAAGRRRAGQPSRILRSVQCFPFPHRCHAHLGPQPRSGEAGGLRGCAHGSASQLSDAEVARAGAGAARHHRHADLFSAVARAGSAGRAHSRRAGRRRQRAPHPAGSRRRRAGDRGR